MNNQIQFYRSIACLKPTHQLNGDIYRALFALKTLSKNDRYPECADDIFTADLPDSVLSYCMDLYEFIIGTREYLGQDPLNEYIIWTDLRFIATFREILAVVKLNNPGQMIPEVHIADLQDAIRQGTMFFSRDYQAIYSKYGIRMILLLKRCFERAEEYAHASEIATFIEHLNEFSDTFLPLDIDDLGDEPKFSFL